MGKGLALLLGVASVMGCGDSSSHASSDANPDADPDASSHCPSLGAGPQCAPHALANIDLSGTWTMTGTETDNHCMSGMPTTTPSSYAITFHVVGCGYDGGGQIDDTIAVRTSSGPQISSREYVCVDATSGLLAYSLSQTQRCIPTNPTPDTIVVEGTLQR